MKAQLSDYDERALRETYNWRYPKVGRFSQAMKLLNQPLEKASDLILATPVLGDAIKLSTQGLIGVCSDGAQWSVQPEVIYADFRKVGHSSINGPADVFSIELEHVDHVVGWLGARYKGITLAEGAAAGAVGLPGIAPDIVALITLNLRAIGEYATYYGFDVSSQQERVFTMLVLGLAFDPTDSSKVPAMAEFARIAQEVAKRHTWEELRQHQFVQLMEQLAKALGIRLTKAKLAQVVPAIGAAVGGGFNAYFTAKVCDAAYFSYRERFLEAQYGTDIIEAYYRSL